MRKRFIQQPDGTLVEVSKDYVREPSGVLIVPDLPGYQSPVTGLWVEGRAARREDLKRTGCRPYEGLDQERKEAQRQASYQDQKLDSKIHEGVSRSFYQLSPEKRELLRRG